MDMKMFRTFLVSLFLLGGLVVQQAMAEGEVDPCETSDAAASLVVQMIADGSAPAAAVAEALAQYSCAVESVVKAAVENSGESDYAAIINTALGLAGDRDGEVASGAVLAGIDPTPYLPAAAGPTAGTTGGLPDVTTRTGGGRVASPS